MLRRSILRIAMFNPTSAQLAFPCLQQLVVEPTAAGLVTRTLGTAQQIFDEVHGNYLGFNQFVTLMARVTPAAAPARKFIAAIAAAGAAS